MSFTDGKRWIATEEDCAASWEGARNGKRFRCNLCGHRFEPGDGVRWVYTNSTPGASGNPLVCDRCDGPDVVERWRAARREADERFWWMRPAE